MGSSTETTSVPTTPQALDPAVGTAVQSQGQLLPQQAQLLQQLGQMILGGQAPGQQALDQAGGFISQGAGLVGGAQGLQGGPLDVQGLIQGLGGGGISSGGLTRSGFQDTARFADLFAERGAAATQPAFDLASRQAFGQLRQFAPNIASTAFQEQGIDLGSRLGAGRQAALNQLFTAGGQLGQQDLGTRRGLQGQLAQAKASVFGSRAGLFGQLQGLQNERDIFQAGFPIAQGEALGQLGAQLGNTGQQLNDFLAQLLQSTTQTVQGQTNFGRPFPTDTVVEQNPGFFNNFIAPILNAGAGVVGQRVGRS